MLIHKTWHKWTELSSGRVLQRFHLMFSLPDMWPYPVTDIQPRHFQPRKVNRTHSLGFVKDELWNTSQERKKVMRVRCNHTLDFPGYRAVTWQPWFLTIVEDTLMPLNGFLLGGCFILKHQWPPPYSICSSAEAAHSDRKCCQRQEVGDLQHSWEAT